MSTYDMLIQKGEKKGEKRGEIKGVKALLKVNAKESFIAKELDISIEEIRKIKAEMIKNREI